MIKSSYAVFRSKKIVTIDPSSTANPWRAGIKVNGKRKWLGYFSTQEAAAQAYDEASKVMNSEFTCQAIIPQRTGDKYAKQTTTA